MSSAQCVPKGSHCRKARINTIVTEATESQRFAFTQPSNVQIVFNGRKGKVASYLISASKRSLGRNPAGPGCSPKYQFVYHYCLSLTQQRSELRLQTGSLVYPLDADWYALLAEDEHRVGRKVVSSPSERDRLKYYNINVRDII